MCGVKVRNCVKAARRRVKFAAIKIAQFVLIKTADAAAVTGELHTM